MQVSRRTLLLGSVAVAASAAMPVFVHAAQPSPRIRWQTWPFDVPRPREWVEGTGSLDFFLKRVLPHYPEAQWQLIDAPLSPKE